MRSCAQHRAYDPLIRADGGAQLVDVDVLIRSVRDMDRSRTEQERRAPSSEERDVGRISDRRNLEPWDGMKMLGRDVRPPLELRAALGPPFDLGPDGFWIANETKHDLCFGRGRDDVRLGAREERSDVQRGFTEHVVLREIERLELWQQ